MISLRNRFATENERPLQAPELPARIAPNPQQQSTISDMLSHKNQQNTDQTFLFQASITGIINGKTWYYRSCPQCCRRVFQKRGQYSCDRHDRISEPNFTYCIGALIVDETGTTSETLLDSAVHSLLGITCKDMVLRRGFENPRVIPAVIHTIKGQTKQMHVHYTTNSYDFKINRVLPLPPSRPHLHKPLHQIPPHLHNHFYETSRNPQMTPLTVPLPKNSCSKAKE